MNKEYPNLACKKTLEELRRPKKQSFSGEALKAIRDLVEELMAKPLKEEDIELF